MIKLAIVFVVACSIIVVTGMVINVRDEDSEPKCTSAISAIDSKTNKPVTIWYPEGCNRG